MLGKPSTEYEGRFNLADHVLGLVAIANGDREAAEFHFRRSIAKPYVNVDHYWGEAFLKRLLDYDWPCENPKMSGGQSGGEPAAK